MLKKRIPTILGLVLLLAGAIAGVVFVSQETDFLPRAAPEFQPQKVRFTNLSENSFIVSWITQDATIGYIKYGTEPNELENTITDERDQLSGNSGDYRTHYINVQGLEPSTTYYFKIYSQRQAYDCEGKTCAVTTASVLDTPPPADTAYGTVLTPAQTPAEGALVYFTLPDTQPLSALVKKDGNYVVSLSTARSLSNQSYAVYDASTTRIDILVQPSTGSETRSTTTTGNSKPVPTITLGETSDFTSQAAKTTIPATPLPTAESTPTPDPIIEASDSGTLNQGLFSLDNLADSSPSAVKITTIDDKPVTKSVTTTIDETQPVIAGTAPKGTKITISVHSNTEYTGTVTVGSSGEWEWSPPADLEPGDHTITISYLENGATKTATKKFVIAAASASLTPAYTSSPSATPKSSPTPTASISGRPSYPSTSSGVPKSGVETPTLIMIFSGLSLMGIGWHLLYKHS